MLNKLALSTAVTLTTLTLGIVTESVQAITVIDTSPFWDGSNHITNFGENNTATYGQTFTVPVTDNTLNSFSLILGPSILYGQPPVSFAGYVAQWDGSKATGNILYSSSPQTYDGNGFQTFSFNTGGISLTSGQQYVAFLSASNFFDGNDHLTGMAFSQFFTDVYPGGEFVYFNNGSNFGALTTNNWDGVGHGFGDAIFTASFTQVPEPTSAIALLIFGGLGLGLKRKKRK